MTEMEERREADKRALELIRKTDATLFVEAGAGTGKTTALVNRLISLVEFGIPIDRIVAITFTERAAAELRDRVRSGLEAAREEGGVSTGNLDAALESLDRAQMSTIHAFCSGLLRSFAAEAGVDPDFTILDEVAATRRHDEQWRAYLDGLGSGQTATNAIDRALSLGLTTAALARLALEMVAAGDLASVLEMNPHTDVEPGWPDFNDLQRKLEATGFVQVPEDDRLRQCLVHLAEYLTRVSAVPERERDVVLASVSVPKVGNGRQANWHFGVSKDEALAIGSAITDSLSKLLAGLRSKALADLLPYIVRFARQDEAKRGWEGSLTYDDLIVLARELLDTSAAARASFRERYTQLLIDEFQDTDLMQVQIARAFATDPDTGDFEHGRLFLVGDPKQSIYRFRGADMAVFAEVRRSMQVSGATFAELSVNRRSRPEILHWVNRVFASIIGDGSSPETQPEYRAIHPHRGEQLAGPGVATIGDSLESPVGEIRVVEAETITALCRDLVEANQWQVVDGTTVRNAHYGDIAILIPTRSNLDALERAFESSEIPYRIEGGSLIFRTQEVRDIINCLTAIDNPADEIAVVGTLRSPAFACSDRDLAQFKKAGAVFNYLSVKNRNRSGPVAEGLQILAAYHARRHEGSLAALVEDLVGETGVIESSVLFYGNRNGLRRTRYIIERARAFEAAGPESLRSLVSWLERQTEGKTFDREGADLDDDEDAVRIMTIHASKGLEFPIVIMAGLSARPVGGQAEVIRRDYQKGQYGIAIGAKTQNRQFVVGDYEDLRMTDLRHDEAERIRTLYVAATRARDHLVVSLYRKGNDECPAKTLFDGGAADQVEHLEISMPARGRPVPFAGIHVDDDPSLSEENLIVKRAELERKARIRQYTSATALKTSTPGRGGDDRPEREDDTEPWSRGRARTRLGRAVHATIQSLPLDAGIELVGPFSQAQAVAEAVPHLKDEVERLVTWIITESTTWKRAGEASRALREVPFAIVNGNQILEGFIDMVIETPDGLEIVDWKTDRITERELDDRLQEYKMQAGLYVYGLQEATGRDVTRVTYIFASPERERSPGEPRELARAARLALLSSSAPV